MTARQTIIPPAERLDSVQEYYFSKKLREIATMSEVGKEVLNLGIGSPDLPPHKEVIAALNKNSQMVGNHSYQSYWGIPELRQAFAEWYRKHYHVTLNPDNEVLPLIGSKEGILHIAMSFLGSGDAALVPNPGYPAYGTATRLAGADVIEYKLSEEDGWLPDLDHLESMDLGAVKIMWVNYPNMPTGANANIPFFEKLIAFAKKHKILLVNDNPYSFVLNDNYLSILSLTDAKDVALELNSLSKSHNMAGWRVGMLAGNTALLQTVLRFKSNMDSGMFLPVQMAATKALGLGNGWHDELNEAYLKRRKKVYELLSILKCSWQPEATGIFIWAKVPDEFKDGYEFSDIILEQYHIFHPRGDIWLPRK